MEKNKARLYDEVRIEIVVFGRSEDVLTASGDNDGEYPEEWGA